eukprot:TRINITY_DN652_c1_g1_i1.p1 TRINITY_DN652_c1_g1~~TRINITY_DN652_c1_g1_i1.p1  ORF type:complete len:1086 (+),score=383.84 TRINITY_DN652_c1_g1_i1:58-3258(+)
MRTPRSAFRHSNGKRVSQHLKTVKKVLQFTPAQSKSRTPAPLRSALKLALTLDQEPVKVVLRIRPAAARESKVDLGVDADRLVLHPPRGNDGAQKFSFHTLFRDDTTQDALFQQVGLPLVNALIAGTSGLLFAYGMTNAGKTFTVFGTPQQPGLVPRIAEALIKCAYAASGKDGTADDDLRYSSESTTFDISSSSIASSMGNLSAVPSALGSLPSLVDTMPLKCSIAGGSAPALQLLVSCIEICGGEKREQLYDLLQQPSKDRTALRKKLKFAEEGKHKFVVKGLTECPVRNVQEAIRLLHLIQENRTEAATALNLTSSRSHCVLTFKLVSAIADSCTLPRTLTVVDLAGSERTDRTQNTGERLKETSCINNSLSVFRNVIEALRKNQQRSVSDQLPVPFRNSRLTTLLQEFFSNNGKATMIVNISPSVEDYNETLQVLRFSAVAREVCTNMRIDTGRSRLGLTPAPDTVRKRRADALLCGSDDVAGALQALRAQLQQREEAVRQEEERRVRAAVVTEMVEQLALAEEYFRHKIAQEKEQLHGRYEQQIGLLRRAYDAQVAAERADCDARLARVEAERRALTEERRALAEEVAVLDRRVAELAAAVSKPTAEEGFEAMEQARPSKRVARASACESETGSEAPARSPSLSSVAPRLSTQEDEENAKSKCKEEEKKETSDEEVEEYWESNEEEEDNEASEQKMGLKEEEKMKEERRQKEEEQERKKKEEEQERKQKEEEQRRKKEEEDEQQKKEKGRKKSEQKAKKKGGAKEKKEKKKGKGKGKGKESESESGSEAPVSSESEDDEKEEESDSSSSEDESDDDGSLYSSSSSSDSDAKSRKKKATGKSSKEKERRRKEKEKKRRLQEKREKERLAKERKEQERKERKERERREKEEKDRKKAEQKEKEKKKDSARRKRKASEMSASDSEDEGEAAMPKVSVSESEDDGPIEAGSDDEAGDKAKADVSVAPPPAKTCVKCGKQKRPLLTLGIPSIVRGDGTAQGYATAPLPKSGGGSSDKEKTKDKENVGNRAPVIRAVASVLRRSPAVADSTKPSVRRFAALLLSLRD